MAKGNSDPKKVGPGAGRHKLDPIITSKFDVFAVIRQDYDGLMYKAEQKGNQRKVALKVLHPDYRIASKKILAIRHQNILRQIAFMSLGSGNHCVVTERPNGEPLSERLAREGKLDSEDAVEIISQALSAVGVVHRKEFVVGNITCQSIFVEEGPRGLAVQVAGIGVKRKNGGPDFLYYCAPELVTGDNQGDIGATADIWSIGVILYETVFGRRPFSGNNPQQITGNILLKDPVFPDRLSPEMERLKAIIMRALAKEPGQRYQSVREFLRDLRLVHAALKRSSEMFVVSQHLQKKKELTSKPAKPSSRGLFDAAKSAESKSNTATRQRSKIGAPKRTAGGSIAALRQGAKGKGNSPRLQDSSTLDKGLFARDPKEEQAKKPVWGDISKILPKDYTKSERPLEIVQSKTSKDEGKSEDAKAKSGPSLFKSLMGSAATSGPKKSASPRIISRAEASARVKARLFSSSPPPAAVESPKDEKGKFRSSAPPRMPSAGGVASKGKFPSSTPPPIPTASRLGSKAESRSSAPPKRNTLSSPPAPGKATKRPHLSMSQALTVEEPSKAKLKDPTLAYVRATKKEKLEPSTGGFAKSNSSADPSNAPRWMGQELPVGKKTSKRPGREAGRAASAPASPDSSKEIADFIIGEDADVEILGVEELDRWESEADISSAHSKDKAESSGASKALMSSAKAFTAAPSAPKDEEEETSSILISSSDALSVEPVPLEDVEEETSSLELSSAEVLSITSLEEEKPGPEISGQVRFGEEGSSEEVAPAEASFSSGVAGGVIALPAGFAVIADVDQSTDMGGEELENGDLGESVPSGTATDQVPPETEAPPDSGRSRVGLVDISLLKKRSLGLFTFVSSWLLAVKSGAARSWSGMRAGLARGRARAGTLWQAQKKRLGGEKSDLSAGAGEEMLPSAPNVADSDTAEPDVGSPQLLRTRNLSQKRVFAIVAISLFFVGVLGLGLFFLWPSEGAREKLKTRDTSPARSSLKLEEESQIPEATAQESEVISPSTVTLSFQGLPMGATILINGEKTLPPITVDRSDNPTQLTVLADGYLSFEDTVIPSEDRMIHLSMQRVQIDKPVTTSGPRRALGAKGKGMRPVGKKPMRKQGARSASDELQKNLASNPFGE